MPRKTTSRFAVRWFPTTTFSTGSSSTGHFQHGIGANPFGFSSTNLGSFYKGLVGDMTKNFKHLRKTRHAHHPMDDAKGDAEALLTTRDELALRIVL